MALINIRNIFLHYGRTILLDGVDIQIHEKEKICLLGRNGAGKTTMMKLINGDIEPDSGSVIRSKGVTTAMLPQAVPEGLHGPVRSVAAEIFSSSGIDDDLVSQKTDQALSLVTLSSDVLYENCSAGMKRRLLLGCALARNPDVLLLDEPTNHLDIDAIRWLEDVLLRYNRTVFLVTHDRAFMMRIADRIIELDRGKLFDWKCDYKTFLNRKEAWLEAEENRNAQADKKLEQEEAWIRQGVKARRTRNEGRVRELLKLREERAQRRERQGNVRMEISKAASSGEIVIEAETVSFGWDSRTLVRDFSTLIGRGDKIGIIGPNGCGKTTLIRLLLHEIEPTAGRVRTGTRIRTVYFDQLHNHLDESKSVRENVSDNNDAIELNGRSMHVIGYLRRFLFPPEMADLKVSMLSGGEKNRLLLAKFFARPSNFIVMDEPTNDLDVETIELLEEMLVFYTGTVLIVSHDRQFLNNVATSIYSFEGNGAVRDYAGGYDDWLEQKKETAATKERPPKEPVREKRIPSRQKLTFKEKKEFEELPGQIESRENRRHEIYGILADPAIHRTEGDRVAALKAELASLETEIDTLMARWEELGRIEAG